VRALAALALCACSGTTGTVKLELTTAPGSHVLDAVDRLRVTLAGQVIEATRTASGFDLALELDATGAASALIVEGFDAAGTLVACGQSPRFPISAINAQVVVYLAAPRSIGVAPGALSAARSEVAASALDYGAVIAGGHDAAGAPSTSIAVYNAYDHSLVEGVALPAPRAGLAITATSGGQVYLFGGTGADGNPTGTLWRFDTSVAPNGAAFVVSDDPGFARTGQLIVPLPDRYLITGTPALELVALTLQARTDLAGLPAVGATAAAGGTRLTVFAGAPLIRFRDTAPDTLAGSAPLDATAHALPDGRVVFFGGGDPASRDAIVVSADGTVTVIPDALATPRAHPTIAATSRQLLVAGGTDAAGAPIATAELFDAMTLAPLATLPILARSGGFAIALPNDQILLGGGAPAAAALELYTPEPP
jgi:Galactose oxidase, central domain